MQKNERTERLRAYILLFSCAVLFGGCCTRPKPVEPIIEYLEQQQAASTVIVERIEVETIKLVTELQTINAPPEIIERAVVIVKDAADLKASLEKERILTTDLKIRVSDLITDRDRLETDRNRVRGQRNVAFMVLAGVLALAALAFWLK